ncbi:hypothetical protein F5Y15DRAFT_381130 [Xylariaceae sp. FL0016]|nr:hypothetical protein F5Y15DRAFT_381130 [Xylariaceae sp. FL0016]
MAYQEKEYRVRHRIYSGQNHGQSQERSPLKELAGFGGRNSNKCVNTCYDQYIDGRELRDVCIRLQQDLQYTLQDLYCCDSSCGVALRQLGDSPNVNLLINKCKEHNNYYIVTDPGPPTVCTNAAGVVVSNTISQPTTIKPESSSQGGLTAEELTLPPDPTSTGLPSLTPAHSMVSAQNTSSSTTSTSGLPSSPTFSSRLSEGSKIAIGICSCVALLAVIALALLFLHRRKRDSSGSFLTSITISPRHTRTSSEPPSSSRTPLISPLTSASSRVTTLTPPARLSERRCLASLLKPSSISSPCRSDSNSLAFPTSPVFAPWDNRLTPRHERRVTTSGVRFPLSPPPPAALKAHRRHCYHQSHSSVYSLSSAPNGGSTATFAPSIASGSLTIMQTATGASTPPLSPLSPVRSTRAYEGPFDRPDMADTQTSTPTPTPTPAGPPPTRALPLPPPNHPNSPTFSPNSCHSSVGPMSPRSPPFAPRALALSLGSRPSTASPPPATAIPSPVSPMFLDGSDVSPSQPHHDSGSIGVALAARELCDLTEAYAREREERERESWGRWSGAGGGGPGVMVGAGTDTGRKRGSGGSRDEGKGEVDRDCGHENGDGDRSVVALRELDLAKLGGKY